MNSTGSGLVRCSRRSDMTIENTLHVVRAGRQEGIKCRTDRR